MKKIESHTKLFDSLCTEKYTSSPDRVKRIYSKVMEQAELPQKNMVFRKRTILLVAALVATSLFMIAAGFFSASDAFRGYLKEPGHQGAENLSFTAPIVDRTGQVLELAKPVISGNLQVTAVALAGDSSTFTILFEVVDITGDPISIRQEDGSLSRELFMFRRSQVTTPSIPPGSGYSKGMEVQQQQGKTMVLQQFGLYQPVPMGETIHVELEDLWQRASPQGKETGLTAENLYTTLARFPAIFAGDFGPIDSFTSVNGNPQQALQSDSEISIPLSGALEGYTLTNAGFYDGGLHLRGTAPAEIVLFDDLRGGQLVGPDDATAIPSAAMCAGSNPIGTQQS